MSGPVRRLENAVGAPRILRAEVNLLHLVGRNGTLSLIVPSHRCGTARNPASYEHHYGGQDALHYYHLHSH